MRASRISRDEIVERGMNQPSTHTPWIYTYKVKSGTRRTLVCEGQYKNIRHLYAAAIRRHARESEALSIYAISRVMRSTLRSMERDV